MLEDYIIYVKSIKNFKLEDIEAKLSSNAYEDQKKNFLQNKKIFCCQINM